jgi:hypothetical protein
MMVINRPMIFKRGWPGEVRENTIETYLGEWVVFTFPLGNSNAELRMPIDEAREDGLVVNYDAQGEFDFEEFE